MTMYDGPDAAATAAGADQVQVLNNGIDSWNATWPDYIINDDESHRKLDFVVLARLPASDAPFYGFYHASVCWYINSACLSACPSVRPSVAFRYSMETA